MLHSTLVAEANAGGCFEVTDESRLSREWKDPIECPISARPD